MSDQDAKSNGLMAIPRRAYLKYCAGGVLFGMMRIIPAHADDKLSKSAVSYQDHPEGSKQCSTCLHYIAAHNPEAAGRCQIVAGHVGPHGYCIVWAERNPTDSC